MATKIRAVDSDAYIILEHFGDSQEETVLAADGMIPWRNKGFDYHEALGGKTSNTFNGAEALTHVSYMESHDEQWLMFKNSLKVFIQSTKRTQTPIQHFLSKLSTSHLDGLNWLQFDFFQIISLQFLILMRAMVKVFS